MIECLSEARWPSVVHVDACRVGHACDESGVGAAEFDFMGQTVLGGGVRAEFKVLVSVSGVGVESSDFVYH